MWLNIVNQIRIYIHCKIKIIHLIKKNSTEHKAKLDKLIIIINILLYIYLFILYYLYIIIIIIINYNYYYFTFCSVVLF
jgi:uncharacterized membrane protein YqjE